MLEMFESFTLMNVFVTVFMICIIIGLHYILEALHAAVAILKLIALRQGVHIDQLQD